MSKALLEIGKFAANKPTTRKFTSSPRKQSVRRNYVIETSEPEQVDDIPALYNEINNIVGGNIPEGLSDNAKETLRADIEKIGVHITKKDGDTPTEFLMLKDAC